MKTILTAFAAVLALASPAFAKKKPKLVPRTIVTTTMSEPAAIPDNLWHLRLSTGGDVVILLRPDKTPNDPSPQARTNRARITTRPDHDSPRSHTTTPPAATIADSATRNSSKAALRLRDPIRCAAAVFAVRASAGTDAHRLVAEARCRALRTGSGTVCTTTS